MPEPPEPPSPSVGPFPSSAASKGCSAYPPLPTDPSCWWHYVYGAVTRGTGAGGAATVQAPLPAGCVAPSPATRSAATLSGTSPPRIRHPGRGPGTHPLRGGLAPGSMKCRSARRSYGADALTPTVSSCSTTSAAAPEIPAGGIELLTDRPSVGSVILRAGRQARPAAAADRAPRSVRPRATPAGPAVESPSSQPVCSVHFITWGAGPSQQARTGRTRFRQGRDKVGISQSVHAPPRDRPETCSPPEGSVTGKDHE